MTTIKPEQALLDTVIQARVRMIMEAPFFGNLIMGLELAFVPDDDPMFQTLATDGRLMFVNGGFFTKLTPDEQVFALGHELGHVIFDHAGEHSRRGDRNPMGWNIAVDHVTNLTLVDSRIGALIVSNGIKLFCDKKYVDWSAEMIYEDLKKEAQKRGGSGNQKGQGGGQDPGQDDGTGQSDGSGRRVLDEHCETGSFGEGTTDENGNTTYDIAAEGQVPADAARKTQQQARSAVISAARTVQSTKGAGSIPAGVLRTIDEWLESKIDWRELLAVTTSELFREDFTYVRPSKKSWCTNVIIPGHCEGEQVRIAGGLDMSGSIGQHEANLFLSELWGIMQMFENYTIDIWCYDTEVYNHLTFTPENVDELKQYQVKGGGGTCYDCNYNYMKKIELLPDQFINFTDGYPNGGWGDPDYSETVFVITEKTRKPPFGKYAYFEE